jgi:beta-N-acetylhexosaminidase
MEGHTPSASLLDRARRGRIGGVLIHGWNFSSATQLRSIANELEQAAAQGGQPPLLIAVDQEGGQVKSVSWIPPTLSPPQMGSSDTARTQGRKTGGALVGLGVNTDFAPVADVPASTSSFMYQQGRTWSFSSRETARLANAFALGLGDRGALATMKHFPGLGFAEKNTDDFVVHIDATKSELAPGLRPYRHAVANGVPLVMLSNAVYRAYDRSHAAGWSRPIGTTLLRGELGFHGVTITDSLDGAANTRGTPTNALALKAAKAGTDMLLLTGSEASSRSVFRTLLDAAKAGKIRRDRLTASNDRILALKAGLD